MQRWCPCRSGSHALLDCMQHAGLVLMQSCYLAVLLSCANTGTRALLVSMPMLAPNAPLSPTCNAGAHAIPAAMRCCCPRQASLQHSCATPHLHNNPCNSSTDSIATCSPDPQLPTGGHKPAAPLTPCTHTAPCSAVPPAPPTTPQPSAPLTAHPPQGYPGALGVLVTLGVQAPA